MMLLYANPNVTAKRLNGETASQDKNPEAFQGMSLCAGKSKERETRLT